MMQCIYLRVVKLLSSMDKQRKLKILTSFEDDGVHVFRFEHLIFLESVVEEETLHEYETEVIGKTQQGSM